MLINLCLILSSVTCNVIGQILIKKGVDGLESNSLNFILVSIPKIILGSPLIIAAVFIFGLSFLLWIVVLARVDVSFASPFQGLSYVLTALGAYFIFGESLTFIKVVGILIIVFGIILLTISSN